MIFAAGDAEAYLSLLHAYSRRFGLEIYAYCLMTNHAHLVVVPTNTDSLHRTLRAVHSQYAQRINRMKSISGHLWQGRYNSSALDSNHFLNAVRYVERNPVAAGIVAHAEDYPWSSAPAHCGLRLDPLLEPAHRSSLLKGIADWSAWLAQGVSRECRQVLRSHAKANLPCGTAKFVAGLEKVAGCDLQFRARGGQQRK